MYFIPLEPVLHSIKPNTGGNGVYELILPISINTQSRKPTRASATPIKAEEVTIPHFRPTRGISINCLSAQPLRIDEEHTPAAMTVAVIPGRSAISSPHDVHTYISRCNSCKSLRPIDLDLRPVEPGGSVGRIQLPRMTKSTTCTCASV